MFTLYLYFFKNNSTFLELEITIGELQFLRALTNFLIQSNDENSMWSWKC